MTVLGDVAYADLVGVVVGLVADERGAALAPELGEIYRVSARAQNGTRILGCTFRLGTLRTRSGCFLTYFLRPLRECLAQSNFVCSLKRGGMALLPWVSPFEKTLAKREWQ